MEELVHTCHNILDHKAVLQIMVDKRKVAQEQDILGKNLSSIDSIFGKVTKLLKRKFHLNSVGDSTAAQTSQGVPAQYVTGDGSSGVSEGGAASGGDDDGYSQAESSIKNGEVVASAQGTKSGGTAQTQVQGTYSGSGSFSASAQTADKDRSAQAQVRSISLCSNTNTSN